MNAAGKMVVAMYLAGALDLFGGAAHRLTEEGNRKYVEKAYEDALRAYTEAQVELPEAPELFYDIGNVLFRQGDLAGAEEAWNRAMAGADDDLLADIAHNLGNARYQRQAFQDAVEAYRQALGARPGDRETKRNLELALRRMQAQQQQQQQQQDGKPPEENQDPGEQQEPPGGERDNQEARKPQADQDPEGGEGRQDNNAGGEMSREEAERLLDSLETQEKDNLKKDEEARRRARSETRREKDW